MIEASPLKFYVAKFFFLFVAVILWLVAAILMFQFAKANVTFFAPLIFIALGLIFLYLFVVVNDKVKRVAIGKNKIVIIEADRNSRFSWPEVKSLKIVPFLNLYRVRLRGKKKPVYFFPAKDIDPAFGSLLKATSKTSPVADKKKKAFGIK